MKAPSYVPLGIGSRGPGVHDKNKAKSQALAEKEWQEKALVAGSLVENLRENPSLRPIVRQIMKRINEVLASDPVIAPLLEIVATYRATIDAPAIAEHKLRSIMGPVLMQVFEETEPEPPLQG